MDWFFGNRKEGFFFPSLFFWGGEGHNHSCKAVPLDSRVNNEDQNLGINTEVLNELPSVSGTMRISDNIVTVANET